jgi:beta-N-acetylhexosaminidase
MFVNHTEQLTTAESMTMRQKIGQLFMCGFEGVEANPAIKQLIRDKELGGVIYFRRNAASPQQVKELSEQLQAMAAEKGDLPLLISIDQEGGMVARIDENVALMPGSMTLGATRNLEAAYESARLSGMELRAMGINMNFAPVLDVNNNPLNPVIGVRSYGEDPQLVAEMGVAAIRGYEQASVAVTVKHFPGHGDTLVDSHHGLPTIAHSLERLKDIELVPFAAAIQHGVDSIMTAHVNFPALEPGGIPATLSHRVLTGILREQMGYEGIIVTDCLEMNAIDGHYGPANGAVMAIEAGADLVLISHRLEKQIAGIEAVVEAVENGRISEARINASVNRIIALKHKLQAAEASQSVNISAVGAAASITAAEHIYDQSITLVKDSGLLPLNKKEPIYVVWPEVNLRSEVDETIIQLETLGYWLNQMGYQVKEDKIGNYPSDDQVDAILEQSKLYRQVIIVSYNASFSQNQVRLVKGLAASHPSLVVIAGRNPFDLTEFPEVGTYFASYENRPLAMKAAAKVLTGALKPAGKLPVTLSDAYPYGWSATK